MEGSLATSRQGLGDHDSTVGPGAPVGLSGISSIWRQFPRHSSASEEQEDDLEVEEDEEDETSHSLAGSCLACMTIFIAFGEFLICGPSGATASSPTFTFLSLSCSLSFSSSKVPVDTFLATGEGEALLSCAWLGLRPPRKQSPRPLRGAPPGPRGEADLSLGWVAPWWPGPAPGPPGPGRPRLRLLAWLGPTLGI